MTLADFYKVWSRNFWVVIVHIENVNLNFCRIWLTVRVGCGHSELKKNDKKLKDMIKFLKNQLIQIRSFKQKTSVAFCWLCNFLLWEKNLLLYNLRLNLTKLKKSNEKLLVYEKRLNTTFTKMNFIIEIRSNLYDASTWSENHRHDWIGCQWT